jgi:CDP-6-deoxy-D-xylo-4-hexulose-3-dehydrase
MQAAIGCAQLEKFPGFVEKRKENFQYLYDGLKDLKSITLFEKYPESDPSWFGFLITLSGNAKFSRNNLAEYLENNLIQTRNLFAGNILKHPCFDHLTEGVDYRVSGELTNTDKIMNDSLWIGLYPGMSKEKINYMISKIREFCKK